MKQILLKLEKKDFIRFEDDTADKRKQRIVLTGRCMEFCGKNDETSRLVMGKMFAGIPEEDIITTIQTITNIEKNLRGFEQ